MPGGRLPPNVDCAGKDFDALRERLIALVRSVFLDWSDVSVASFGNALLEMFAFVGHVLGFHCSPASILSALACYRVADFVEIFG
jgi:hypothetical protein